MKSTRVISLMLLFTLLSIGCDSKRITPNSNLECKTDQTEELTNFILNGVDVETLTSFEIYENVIYATHSFGGEILRIDINGSENSKIADSGRGPYEFERPYLYMRGETLYIYDLIQSKIATYSLKTEEFVSEILLPEKIYGILIHISGKIEMGDLNYIFVAERKANRYSIAYQDILNYNSITNKIDTVDSFENKSQISYWDDLNKADYGLILPMISTLKYGEFKQELVRFDPSNLTFEYVVDSNKLGLNFLKDEFQFIPQYNAYSEAIINDVDNWDLINPIRTKEVYKRIINENRKLFDSYASRWFSNETHIIFELYSDKNEYLVVSLTEDKQSRIICDSLDFKLHAIDENWTYWLKNNNEDYTFTLSKRSL